MGLLDEVWEQDTTLIDVLDETGIANLPEYKNRLTVVENEQVYQKSQLDSLGVTVNNYQQSTEAEILAINTRLDNNSKILDALTDKVSELKQNFDDITIEVEQLTNQVEQLTNQVKQINTTLDDVVEQIKYHNKQIDSLETKFESMEKNFNSVLDRVNTVEPTVKYNSNFLTDSTAIFQGSEVVIVDIGGNAIEWAYCTIGPQSRLPTAPVKFIVKYALMPAVNFNNKRYVYISFVGIGRTHEQPLTAQDTLVSWGYQVVRLWRDYLNGESFSVFIIKRKYDLSTITKNKYVK